MTVYVPDISHWQAGIDIQALKNEGAAALIARVGQGAGRRTNGQTYSTTQDTQWVRHRDEARRVGLPLVAYWYTGNLISADDNARLAQAWVGDKSIPWMIDHEDASGSMAFYCQVVAAFRARGLRVILGYVPRWYYDGQEGGDLRCGPSLVNSRYSTASGTPASIYHGYGGDTGVGWTGYGQRDVALWQFTNKASMAGRAIDCSAWRGTVEALHQLINGDGDDMQPTDLVVDPATGQPALDTNGNTYTYNQAWYYTNLSGWVLREGVDQLKAGMVATQAAIAAIATNQDITPAELATIVNKAVADNTPTAEQVAAAQGEILEQLIRDVVPEEMADQVVQKLGEKLASGTPAPFLTMQNLLGSTPDQARDRLRLAGWTGTLHEQDGTTNDVAELGKIVAQNPASGLIIAPAVDVIVTVARTLDPGGQ